MATQSSPVYRAGGWLRVRRGRPCPTCGKYDKPCSWIPDEISICVNVQSDRPAGGCVTAWLHFLRPVGAAPRTFTPKPAATPVKVEAYRADADHLDGVYSTVLRGCGLSLSAVRRAGLHARGLTDEAIRQLGCVDTPTETQGDEIAAHLAQYGLEGVPGFYRRGGQWKLVKCALGFFCAYRDLRGRIQGLQYRLDVPQGKRKYIWLSSNPDHFPAGTSSGTPLHIAGRHLIADSPDVLISEGSLKADCAAFLGGVPVVAGGGVSCFGHDFGAWFKATFPDKRAAICFDADWALKREVRTALQRLRTQLRDAGVPFVVRTWDARHKGIDDYLLACTLDHSAVLEVAA